MSERLKIVVGGFLGLTPGGGVAWDYVQWPLGFAELGHDVIYVEDTRLWPVYENGADGSCDRNVNRIQSVMHAFGLDGRWAYRDEISGRCFGMPLSQLQEFCRSADLFINLSCSTFMRDEYLSIPVRALVDTDPMFTQIQFSNELSFTSHKAGMREMFAKHTHFFTFGENLGSTDCRIPDCGVPWIPIRQPVCLAHWKASPAPAAASTPFTTLMNWSAGRDLEYQGESWGQKSDSLMEYSNLPALVGGIHLAIGVGQTSGAAFPVGLFRDRGWTVLDPEVCAPDWRSYQSFLTESRGEFSIAKQTYVKARTGWFSCRSACYLACGRPVIAQDTGWSKYIPAGLGLLAFDDIDYAREALLAVACDPQIHGAAARQIAEEYFSAEKILRAMLHQTANLPCAMPFSTEAA
jgi:hypothetical protein